jgi:hypothetical protein
MPFVAQCYLLLLPSFVLLYSLNTSSWTVPAAAKAVKEPNTLRRLKGSAILLSFPWLVQYRHGNKISLPNVYWSASHALPSLNKSKQVINLSVVGSHCELFISK